MQDNDEQEIISAFRAFLMEHDHDTSSDLIINSARDFERADCPFSKSGNKHISYFIRTDDKRYSFGFAECHGGSCNFKKPWKHVNNTNHFHNLSPEEKQSKIKEQYENRCARIGDSLKRQADVAKIAEAKWHQAAEKGLDQLEYVRRKNFIPYGLKKWGDTLLIPLRDIHRNILNIEHIYPNGDKRPITGGRVNGLFHQFGEINPLGIVQLAEGVATAGTVWETTDIPTLCCRNANNLINVARAIKKVYPQITLFVCADDDKFKLEKKRRQAIAENKNPPTINAGINAAIAIKNEFSATVALPNFSIIHHDEYFLKQDSPPASDFNDVLILLMKKGFNKYDALVEVRRQLSNTNQGTHYDTDGKNTQSKFRVA